MARSADIVIIGAGIIGLCTAVQIARRAKASITVLDKGAGPGEGSTGASSAVCRYKYTRPEMVRLARDGINAYQHWAAFTGLDAPLARFHRHGVLWSSDGNRDWPAAEAERLRSFGIAADVLDDDALAERFPAISPCVLAPDFETGAPHKCSGGGLHLLEVDGGYFDPVDALHDLITTARALGVDIRFRTRVTGCDVSAGAMRGVTLASGERLACANLVNAAGPWCNDVFDYAGLACPWPLSPTRIQIVHIDRPEAVAGDLPVCVDPLAGIYFRTQNRGQQILVSSVRKEDECERVTAPDDLANYANDDFTREKLHALQHRLPGLASMCNVRGCSGLYTVNESDVHPIVGETPIKGFYVANGFSGHGFKLAPAIASLLAQMITGVKADFDTSEDGGFLSFSRAPIDIASKSVLA